MGRGWEGSLGWPPAGEETREGAPGWRGLTTSGLAGQERGSAATGQGGRAGPGGAAGRAARAQPLPDTPQAEVLGKLSLLTGSSKPSAANAVGLDGSTPSKCRAGGFRKQ